MAQLTIYLDEATLRRVEESARRKGTSLSRWARTKLAAAAEPDAWPQGYAELFGQSQDAALRAPDELAHEDDISRNRL